MQLNLRNFADLCTYFFKIVQHSFGSSCGTRMRPIWVTFYGAAGSCCREDEVCRARVAALRGRETPSLYAEMLAEEVRTYERSPKYRRKLDECEGREVIDFTRDRFGEVWQNLQEHVQPWHSVLDLGCACGALTQKVSELTDGRVVGVDIVPGWIAAARRVASASESSRTGTDLASFSTSGIPPQYILGDMTEGYSTWTFDMIYMADSYEHVPKYRELHLWESLVRLSHFGTKLYIHIPTPTKQKYSLGGAQQYLEKVVEYDDLLHTAACFGFRRIKFQEHAIDTFASFLFERCCEHGPRNEQLVHEKQTSAGSVWSPAKYIDLRCWQGPYNFSRCCAENFDPSCWGEPVADHGSFVEMDEETFTPERCCVDWVLQCWRTEEGDLNLAAAQACCTGRMTSGCFDEVRSRSRCCPVDDARLQSKLDLTPS